jgi:competence protein ComEC
LSGIALARNPPAAPALAAAALVALAVQVPVAAPRHSLAAAWVDLTACDVGQGDALVLPVARHAAVVVDAGPVSGPRRPVPCAIYMCLGAAL